MACAGRKALYTLHCILLYYELYLYMTLADTAVEIASSAQNNKAGLFRAKFGSAKLAQ